MIGLCRSLDDCVSSDVSLVSFRRISDCSDLAAVLNNKIHLTFQVVDAEVREIEWRDTGHCFLRVVVDYFCSCFRSGSF